MSQALGKDPRRDALGRLRPGHSLNPKGRPPRGFAFTEMVREVAGQPHVMRALALRVINVAMGRSVCIDSEWQRACQEAIANGEPLPPEPAQGERMQPTMAEQQRAQEFLFRYGGLATTHQTVELEGVATPIDFARLNPAELDAMERALAKAAGYDELPAPARELGIEQAPLVLDILPGPERKAR